MKIFKTLLLLMVAVMLAGCAVSHDFKAAPGIKNAVTINIVEDHETREGVLDVMTTWLTENGFKHKILPPGSDINQEGWMLTYTAQWSWDLTIYLSKAIISAYNNGMPMGYAKYSATGFDLNKFEKAEPTIRKMMSNLFSK